jgi:hypothetical protein
MEPKHWKSYVQLREGSILKFDYPEEGFNQPSWKKPPTRKGYQGEVTDGTRKRIITAVDILLQINPNRRLFNPIINKEHDFRVSFATTTITDPIRPKTSECNEAITRFVRHFKNPWKRNGRFTHSEPLKEYVWKLELQERGTPHYHLTSGSFLHHVEVNKVWNDIQRDFGWTEQYFDKTGSYQPNSTDIHAVWEVKNLGGYISKYMGKKAFVDTSEMGFPMPVTPVQMGGKIWGCSEGLRGKKRFTAEMDRFTWEKLKASIEFQEVEPVEFERCTIYRGAGKRELSLKNAKDYGIYLSQF